MALLSPTNLRPVRHNGKLVNQAVLEHWLFPTASSKKKRRVNRRFFELKA